MINPKSLANLKPPVKGEIRNPFGAPRKLPDLKILILDELNKEEGGIANGQKILSAIKAKAAKGDIRAAELLWNRGYGLPTQHLQLEDVTNRERVIKFSDGQIKKIG